MPKDQSLKEYLDGNELDLSLHNLTVVPVKELAAIPKAIKLDLSCNQLTGLPESFCSSLTHVVKIDLSKNSLSVLPDNFGDLINLQHLDLLGNKLTKLPVSFCELQKLKWLDLKDNPLNNELKKVAGNCLDEKECRQCAQNILQYMKNIEAELQRKRQKKEEVKKKHELARKQKEEQEKEKKKKEKQEEKARKRQEYEAMKAAKKATSKETKTKKVEEEASLLNGYTAERGPVKSGKSSYKSFFYWFIFLVCLLLAIFIGVKYFCEDAGKTDAYCKAYWPQVKNATDPYIKKYWRPAEDFVWKMYNTLSIQMKEIIKNLTTTKNDSVSKDSGTVK